MAFNHQEYNATYLENARAGNEAINDAAEKYGVEIAPAEVAVGETYWKVIGVHHLLPLENWSNHHIYLEALDEAGNRARNPGAWVGWTWENRGPDEPAQPVPVDKPDNEPGCNIAVGKNQIISVWVNGAADAADKSDRVISLRTTHPDEPLSDGQLHNTWGHHSFYVVFQQTTKTAAAQQTGSAIFGRLTNGQGKPFACCGKTRWSKKQRSTPGRTFGLKTWGREFTPLKLQELPCGAADCNLTAQTAWK